MTSDNMREFLRGIGDQLPLQLGVVPFGLVFGVWALQAGLAPANDLDVINRLWRCLSGGFCTTLGHGCIALIVGSSVAVINLRHMLYSAAVAKYLRPYPCVGALFWDTF